ncbi:hypothetical protein [Listeria sp. ILCC792]|uniref:hypothetical protein n=1 Tax=Listeria sp. ILCC792 TaxID=1918331 RepID=UPI000B58D277|nr:hypothetical protein [Listeria sp. ILCC792]
MRKKANLFVVSVVVFAVFCWVAPLAKAAPVPESEITYSAKTSEELSDMFLIDDYTFDSPYVVMNTKNQATVMFGTTSAVKVSYSFQNKKMTGHTFTESHQFTISGLKPGENHILLESSDKNGHVETAILTVSAPEKETSKQKHGTQMTFYNLATTREVKQYE